MTSFSGRIALITGGASGIGAACSTLLVERGARALIADRNEDAAEDLAHSLGESGLAFALDVTDPAQVAGLFARLSERSIEPDILINSAGIREIAHPLALSHEEWNRVLAINLTGSFLLCQAFARARCAQAEPGAIVNVASTSSILASPNRTAYVSSKHGVVGLTKQLALELGPMGIRVNAVAPGVVRTPLTESYFQDEERVSRLRAAYPLGRAATPDDVAEVALFLASDAARFVSGAVVPVDGGYTAGKTW